MDSVQLTPPRKCENSPPAQRLWHSSVCVCVCLILSVDTQHALSPLLSSFGFACTPPRFGVGTSISMYSNNLPFSKSSTSMHVFSRALQACELRDGGSRYNGKGVLQAVKNVNEILGPMVVGMDPTKQQDLDDVSSVSISCMLHLDNRCPDRHSRLRRRPFFFALFSSILLFIISSHAHVPVSRTWERKVRAMYVCSAAFGRLSLS